VPASTTNPSAPTISSVSPSDGVNSGGTLLTIVGTNFVAGATGLTIGGVAATVNTSTATQMTAFAPAKAAGTYQVIATAGGLASAESSGAWFTYFSPKPTFSGLNPGAAQSPGGSSIAITGTNLGAVNSISVGGTPAAITGQTAAQLTFTSPLKAPGTYRLSASSPSGGSSDENSSSWLTSYSPTPVITTISPSDGPTAGGSTFTITGTNLLPANGSVSVQISNGTAVSTVCPVSSTSATQLTLSSPAGLSGTYRVQVVVTIPGLSGPLVSDESRYTWFTYFAAKQDPYICWSNPADITYGAPLSGTQLNATASVGGAFVYNPPAGTILAAGSRTLSATFTPTDTASFNTVTTSRTINVLKATPTVTWAAPANIAYPTALSAAQLNATASVAGTFAYTPPPGTVLAVGANQTLTANFTPTDPSYNSVTTTRVITVVKGTAVITWAPPAGITYPTPLSATQLNATSSVPGTLSYVPAAGVVLAAGANQTLTANFVPSDAANYNSTSGTQHIDVAKGMPVITWAAPADITYPTALSAAQLNATASVAGSFTYTPVAGTVLPVGAGQALTATFTPADASYNAVTTTRLINVVRANCVPDRMPFALPATTGVPVVATVVFTNQHGVAGGGCAGNFVLQVASGGYTLTVGAGTFTATVSGTVATANLVGSLSAPYAPFTFGATLTLDTATHSGTIRETFATPGGPVVIVVAFARYAGFYVVTGVTVLP
jgi:hypothetical protein